MRSDATYSRYSSHAQDDSTSIEVQVEACEKALGGTATILHFADRARTGRAAAGREGLSQLMSAARAGRLQRVCVWRFSRIGRNLAESAGIIQELEDFGVQVISAMEGSDPLSRSIFLAMAEHYSRELAQNTRGGLLKKFQQREHIGGEPPLGYKVVTDQQGKKRIAINEAEIPAVKHVLAAFSAGILGYKGIAKECQAKGFSTRRGQRWSPATVRGILTNPIVAGTVYYNRRHMKLNRKTGRRVHRKNDVAAHLSYHEPALQIITRDEWQHLQDRFKSKRSHPALPERLRRAWTGLLRCGCCGSSYYSRKSKNAKGEYIYYNCGYRQRMGPDVCSNSKSLREDGLLADFQTATRIVFDRLDTLIEHMAVQVMEQMKDGEIEQGRLKAEIVELEKRNKALLSLLLDLHVNAGAKETISGEMAVVAARLIELRGSIEALATRERVSKGEIIIGLRSSIDEIKQGMEQVSTSAELNELLSKLVGPLIVAADGSLSPQTQSAPVLAGADVTDYIAGARYTALHIAFRDTFLALRRAA
jgi:site-specific DNA recombinase